QLGTYKTMKTEDGSLTVWSEYFQEACHSMAGATQETDLYYIQGCRIGSRASLFSPFSILEIGFGIGISYQRTIEELLFKAPQAYIHYLSVEIDEGLMEWNIQQANLSLSSPFPQIKDLKRGSYFGIPCFQAKAPQGNLTILIGDARE